MARVPAALFLLSLGAALGLPAPARGEWTRLGAGDCAGPEAGSSKGLSPARSKCDASAGGMTAICWDGKGQVNPAVKGAGCVYRRVRAEACQGGPHPGTVFRCDGYPLATPKPKGATAPAAKAGPPAAKAGPSEQPPAEPPAQTAPEPGASAAHKKVQAQLNKAADLFAAKDFAGALAELRRAQDSEDLAVVRFNIARCLEELERPDEAVQAYQDYLTAPDVAAGSEVRRGYAHQTIALLSGENEQPAETPASETLAWKFLRIDDCGGEEAGNSDGASPAAPLCVPATAGNAAVCWDGVQRAHPAFKGPACVYKSAPASTCKGGPNPGALYECASRSASAAATPPPATPRPNAEGISYSWQYVGAGDCTGGDATKSKGAEPALERCNASQAGKLAVCWDGMTQRNPAIKGAGCTYKRFGAKACKPGSTPGLVFECVAENDSVSQLLGPPPPAAKPADPAKPASSTTTVTAASTTPAPASPPKPGTWVAAGTGDCVGGPMGVSKGLGPSRSRCDSAHLGQVAVCWDGTKHKNPAIRGAGCSYQSVKAESCRGGPHPGALFRCGP
ncbi:MAG TPA: tetratricopeptide repeat protein [Myxococcales bacterium]|jgi:hypothetical protein